MLQRLKQASKWWRSAPKMTKQAMLVNFALFLMGVSGLVRQFVPFCATAAWVTQVGCQGLIFFNGFRIWLDLNERIAIASFNCLPRLILANFTQIDSKLSRIETELALATLFDLSDRQTRLTLLHITMYELPLLRRQVHETKRSLREYRKLQKKTSRWTRLAATGVKQPDDIDKK